MDELPQTITVFQSTRAFQANQEIAHRNNNNSLSIGRGPGKLLDIATQKAGRMLEKQIGRLAHKAGRGPHAKASLIDKLFSKETRVIEGRLRTLYHGVTESALDISSGGIQLTEREEGWLSKLQQLCGELMDYGLPCNDPSARAQTFSEVTRLCTTYPHIRRIFLRSKHIAQSNDRSFTLADSVLWKREDHFHPEWEFYQPIVQECLSESELTRIIEEKSPDTLCEIPESRSGVLEKLLSIQDDTAVSKETQMIAVRYMCGILRLSYFWQLGFDQSWPITRKLLKAACRHIEDILQSSPLLTKKGTEQNIFDGDGIDMFAEALVVGINGQATERTKSNHSQEWLRMVGNLIDLIGRPDIICLPRLFATRSHLSSIWEEIANHTISPEMICVSSDNKFFKLFSRKLRRRVNLREHISHCESCFQEELPAWIENSATENSSADQAQQEEHEQMEIISDSNDSEQVDQLGSLVEDLVTPDSPTEPCSMEELQHEQTENTENNGADDSDQVNQSLASLVSIATMENLLTDPSPMEELQHEQTENTGNDGVDSEQANQLLASPVSIITMEDLPTEQSPMREPQRETTERELQDHIFQGQGDPARRFPSSFFPSRLPRRKFFP
ncbi:hypothetical protein M422DRAFT_70302 [Sphaerobolus stellatus SS14]|uniref:Uncharacterized protein n=1 Tax=Sphaerobolus stellatus (strain SS14) TaxID=990650 RepID=A0A0C9UXI1_SPHS4|nr:hypothetical protein M422DRAFT_70302 [Sphaerobolus stellatus SS14]